MTTTNIPLLDERRDPIPGFDIQIDTEKLTATLLENGSVEMTVRLKKTKSGRYAPADPLIAHRPRSAFEHTVNIWCNEN